MLKALLRKTFNLTLLSFSGWAWKTGRFKQFCGFESNLMFYRKSCTIPSMRSPVQIVVKGAKNRATARRTASEKKKHAGKINGQSPAFFHSLPPHPSSRLSPLSKHLGQATNEKVGNLLRWLIWLRLWIIGIKPHKSAGRWPGSNCGRPIARVR